MQANYAKTANLNVLQHGYLFFFNPNARNQGCGVGVEAGVGVGRSRPFCLESESELESVKFRRLRLRLGVAGHQPSTDNGFGRTVMHRPVNIENGTKRRAVVWRLS